MKIREIMSTPGVAVSSLTPVASVARQMDYEGVGCVLVVDDGQLTGLITDRDIALRVVGESRSGDTPAGQIMSSRPVTVGPDDEVDVAAHAFRRGEFRRLPVVDSEQVLGMVTLDDLLLVLHRQTGDLLEPVASEIREPQHGQT